MSKQTDLINVTDAITVDGSNVGIGTSSPSGKLSIEGATATSEQSHITFENTSGAKKFAIGGGKSQVTNNGFAVVNVTDNTSPLFIDDSGKVGIGTSSPAHLVDAISTTGSAAARFGTTYNTGSNDGTVIISNGGSGDAMLRFDYEGSNTDRARIGVTASDQHLQFFTAGNNERMRILSTGSVLFGQSSNDRPAEFTQPTGASIAGATGYLHGQYQSSVSGLTMLLNRKGSDGQIIGFRKDGADVGSIGNSGNYMFLASLGPSSRGVKITDNFIPATTSGANNDNVMDLGGASVRWDDVYATNGTIQTSDRNEKQDIEALNDAETAVAVACKGLLRKFRWIDSVAEKGDDARIHFGIIAQDLQDAFTAESLDAGRYAMFISSTWWETQTDVPAVEAVDEVLDEDGNVVTEAVEAKDAYTRTDTYETLEEAPEGATERTRLGVRYPELLAFIIGAM